MYQNGYKATQPFTAGCFNDAVKSAAVASYDCPHRTTCTAVPKVKRHILPPSLLEIKQAHHKVGRWQHICPSVLRLLADLCMHCLAHDVPICSHDAVQTDSTWCLGCRVYARSSFAVLASVQVQDERVGT